LIQSELSPSTIHAIYAKFLDDCDSENNDAPDPHQAKEMTIEGFASFLQSADNSALHEKHITVHQDMSLPLHDYFISTSHNVCGVFFFPPFM
jgi:phosphatidylinositol phospholipase C delta